MEDVLALYAAPPDPLHPVVCFDELPYQLVDASRPPLPRRPGVPVRDDYEYVRRGTCNLFGCYAPHRGERHLRVTGQRRAVDFAEAIRVLVDEWFPEAERIRLVLDQLNTHTGAALYAAFAPAEARRLVERIEWHHTPKHGSWLNQMEVEWSVLSRQCLDRRIGEVETLAREVAAWERERNAAQVKIDWRFTPEKAREKLARLYPS
jgi:DDE superfamily endonuclease